MPVKLSLTFLHVLRSCFADGANRIDRCLRHDLGRMPSLPMTVDRLFHVYISLVFIGHMECPDTPSLYQTSFFLKICMSVGAARFMDISVVLSLKLPYFSIDEK